MKITTDTVLSWEPCGRYPKDKIHILFKEVCGNRKYATLADALNLRIPLEDLMWLILRSEFIPERKLHEISLFCWDKAIEHIGNKPYRNMEETQEAINVKRRWLKGKATNEELSNAKDILLGIQRRNFTDRKSKAQDHTFLSGAVWVTSMNARSSAWYSFLSILYLEGDIGIGAQIINQLHTINTLGNRINTQLKTKKNKKLSDTSASGTER